MFSCNDLKMFIYDNINIDIFFSGEEELGYGKSNSEFLKGRLINRDYLGFNGLHGNLSFEDMTKRLYQFNYTGQN